MDHARFDRLTVTFARRGTRRSALALLSAVGLTGLVRQETAAQTCIENGERCDPKASPNGCCSGKCSRRRKRCRRVSGQGTCTVEQNNCGTGGTDCNSNLNCACYVTTRGWSVCGDGARLSCASPACEQDKDCDSVTGKGSRCVPCPGTCGSDTLCVQPCPPA